MFPKGKQLSAMELDRAVNEIVPKCYAAFCMTMYTRFGIDAENIGYALRDTHRYWHENENIVSQCYRVTGIDVMGDLRATDEDAWEEGVVIENY